MKLEIFESGMALASWITVEDDDARSAAAEYSGSLQVGGSVRAYVNGQHVLTAERREKGMRYTKVDESPLFCDEP